MRLVSLQYRALYRRPNPGFILGLNWKALACLFFAAAACGKESTELRTNQSTQGQFFQETAETSFEQQQRKSEDPESLAIRDGAFDSSGEMSMVGVLKIAFDVVDKSKNRVRRDYRTCSGTLVASDIVITAAHCVLGYT